MLSEARLSELRGWLDGTGPQRVRPFAGFTIREGQVWGYLWETADGGIAMAEASRD